MKRNDAGSWQCNVCGTNYGTAPLPDWWKEQCPAGCDAAPVTSHARTFAPDPGCGLCQGLGTRHIAQGLTTARVDCPCTLIGPPLARELSELPPIKDTAVLDQYPDCQPRTPIDPVAKISIPGLMKGNSDLKPSTWNPPKYRDCPRCGGRGIVGKFDDARMSGNPMCTTCMGAGTVKL